MSENIGVTVRRAFFIHGTSGPVDFFEGIVRSITSSNKNDIMYDDNDSEEMSEREFAYYSIPPKAQAHMHIARLLGDQLWKDCTSCIRRMLRNPVLGKLIRQKARCNTHQGYSH